MQLTCLLDRERFQIVSHPHVIKADMKTTAVESNLERNYMSSCSTSLQRDTQLAERVLSTLPALEDQRV